MAEFKLPYPHIAEIMQRYWQAGAVAGVVWILLRYLRVRGSARRKLDKLDWEKFEHLVAGVYRRHGYAVEFREKAGADGGVDFRAAKRGKRYIVQCKRWSRRVGVPVVREMAGLLAAERRVNGVIIVTNNEFTKDAIAFAKGKSIELVNGAELQSMMRH